MSTRHYSQLQEGSIRLIQLLPSENEDDKIHCDLLCYPLQKWERTSHPYEALSYVWGGEEKPMCIALANQTFNITRNLYRALLHLRDPAVSRLLWIDAICIDQEDAEEKEHQIPFIAEIYAKARRVVVWLGDAEHGSDNALEHLRQVGEASKPVPRSTTEQSVDLRQAILYLLRRPWFQRMWILQEVAAARQILVMCGSSEIDGYAFCLGLETLGTNIDEATSQVTFLIRQAIFRPRHIPREQGKLSLSICSLGKLLDMYHTYKATLIHDKLYALFGICSDDLTTAGLDPDYNLPKTALMQRIVAFILGNYAFVESWNESGRVTIKGIGCVLGQVSRVDHISTFQHVIVIELNKFLEHPYVRSLFWHLESPVNTVQEGDILCLLTGTQQPIVIRPHAEDFLIILIAPECQKSQAGKDMEWLNLLPPAIFNRNLLLVWDWGTSTQHQQSDLDTGKTDVNDQLQDVQYQSPTNMNSALQKWNVAQVLDDGGKSHDAERKRQLAEHFFWTTISEHHQHSVRCQCYQIPLRWAAQNGINLLVEQYVTRDGADLNLRDGLHGWTPLFWAAQGGHEAVVKLLLGTGQVQVDIDAKDMDGRTPLSLAAEGGGEAVVKLLLGTGQVNVDAKDEWGQTPLSYAAGKGHETMVKLLLGIGQAEVDAKDKRGRTPLSYAVEGGCETVVKLLLGTGQVEVDAKDKSGRTLLSRAAEGGSETVVKLLLGTGQAEVDAKDKWGQTPLSYAVEGGCEMVVKLLLGTGQVDVNAKDESGRTPLSSAARKGHEAVVKLLLGTGQVDVEAKDNMWAQTPLSYAAQGGHTAVVKLLLGTGQANVNVEDDTRSLTPLWYAEQGGHEEVVKLLQSQGLITLTK